MASFGSATSQRIIVGGGRLNELSQHLEGSPKRLLFVHGHSSNAIWRLRDMLYTWHVPFTEFQVHGEPTVEVVREGAKAAQDCEMVIGLGGGSVLDTGKAIAALVTNP